MSQTTFSFGGKDYDVLKKGRAQAIQVAALGRWLAQHGIAAYKSVESLDTGLSAGLEMVSAVLTALSPDALVELFDIVFGCGIAVAEEEFDIALLIAGVESVYNNSVTIRSITDRFFSSSASTSIEADNSTTSEPPTDGPTA